MWLYFLFLIVFSAILFGVVECLKRVIIRRNQLKYLQHLVISSSISNRVDKKILESNLFSGSKTPLFHSVLKYFQNTYDVPKDVNIGQLMFVQLGLIFICWNLAGFLKISLFPLLFLAFLVEVIGVFFFLSKRKLLDQLDKAFPQILDSVSSMYHIHPDLKHSFASSQELVTEPVSKRFLTELISLTKLGVPTVQSLQLMAKRWQYQPLSFMISSIKIHESTGGNLSLLFRQMANSLRRHQQNTKAMQSVMFQNKVSGFVVCALVPVVLLLSISLSSNYREVVFGEPFARSLVTVAIVWWAIGVVVLWKTLRIRV